MRGLGWKIFFAAQLIVCGVWAEGAPRDISYTGAAISAFIPGGGQFYHGRYISGGAFFATELTAVGYAVYWRNEYNRHSVETSRVRGIADSLRLLGAAAGGDSAIMYQAGFFSVFADRSGFEADRARYTSYMGFAWAAGIHLYSFMSALELGGFTPRGAEKSPAKAGFLSAVPFLGLGQIYNERPGKAGMIAMTQSSLAVMSYTNHRLMTKASANYNRMRDPESEQHAYSAEHLSYWRSQYDRVFSQRNTFLWISLFAYLYGIFDAVVDAHLSDYDERIRVGPDLALGVYGSGAMIALSFNF